MTDSRDELLDQLESRATAVEFAVHRLRRVSQSVALATVLNLGLASMSWILRVLPIPRSELLTLAIVALGLMLLSLLLLTRYEQHRRDGQALFEEISDDVQRYSTRRLLADSSAMPTRVEWVLSQTRLSMRKLSRSTDLPLVQGTHGTTVYAIINIGLGIISIANYIGYIARGMG